jgi:hypothetical protein
LIVQLVRASEWRYVGWMFGDFDWDESFFAGNPVDQVTLV